MGRKAAAQAVRRAFDLTRGRARYATIRERIVSGARIDGIHLCQLIAAMIIASIGLNTNSTEAVIGAMLICPLMGSVLAISCSVATMDMRLLKSSLAGLVLQAGVCLVTSTAYFALSPLSSTTSELLANSSATIWDLVIALVGGLAGALGLSRRQEPTTLVSGVAVATALMPPLCAVGYGIAAANGPWALSALYEFLINVVFIAFGATVVLVWLRMPLVGDLDGDGRETPAEREEARRESGPLRHRLAVMLLVFALPCASFTLQVVNASSADDEGTSRLQVACDPDLLADELAAVCPGFERLRLDEQDSYDGSTRAPQQRLVAVVKTTRALDAEDRREAEALIRLHAPDLDEVVFEASSAKDGQ